MSEQLQVVDLSKLYWIIGALIVMNFSTIVTIVVYAVKALWWISKLDYRVQENTKDNNAAHQKIRDIETRLVHYEANGAKKI